MPGLVGMKEISNYMNRSESTILNWIKTMKFPATKITGSWISDTDLIDEWRRNIISNDGQKKPVKRKNR